jgi:hypothetical protein
MELSEIVARFAEGLVAIDSSSAWQGVSRRTGVTYLPGVPAMTERQLCKELVSWWIHNYPTDFHPIGMCEEEVPYPGLPRARCDIAFNSDASSKGREWAIEVKRIQFIGDNGKNNDHNVQKMLSPYMKDRSLVHDIDRMQGHPVARRHAVLGYAFSYDFESCDEAETRHPEHLDRIAQIREVCRVNDPETGRLACDDLIQVADVQFRHLGIVSDHQTQPFKNAWRHPCGGNGTIFGWEVIGESE